MGWFARDGGTVRREPLDTVVGPSASLNGHLRSDGGVRIDGVFEGVIEATGNVVITEGARVVADITAKNITVGGAIKGNIDGAGRLEILSTGEVYGDIMVASVMIDEGGLFQGTSRMRGIGERALPAPAEDERAASPPLGASAELEGDIVDVTVGGQAHAEADPSAGGSAPAGAAASREASTDARPDAPSADTGRAMPAEPRNAVGSPSDRQPTSETSHTPAVAVPDLDLDDIEPIIPDVEIEEPPSEKESRRKKRDRTRR